ncbi:flavodoxin domain-containing protein [Paenibacillus sp. N1-5-1-14]|uniref:flavodoxin domain-containing protein n=1 Tax=Paenibacillus radicibacter TaxID=2972488 RepID=UPI002159618A|nr:flavodoxin domain-containing protein [Paenibacillus radicibacter]MCR8645222.1 flavodoxin domain-containing protein [Paenibacillus radicibacter]
MALLVLYATKTGAATQCANKLAEAVPSCTVINLETEKPDLASFDRIIVGAGVRDGKIYKLTRDFIKKNQAELLNKKMGYFICNEKPKETQEIFERNIPDALKAAAVCMESFGGYKAYKAPSKDEDQLKGIFVDRIAEFADKFKS